MKKTWITSIVLLFTVYFLIAATLQEPAQFHAPSAHIDHFEGKEGPLPSSVDNDDCFICHDDDGLTMDKDGEEISLYVDPSAYEGSPHRSLECIQCHVGFDPDEEPHREDIQPVDCASCHSGSTRSFNSGGHRNALTCETCHGDVHEPMNRAPSERVCHNCHTSAVEENQTSAHAGNGSGPSCTSCHGSHAAVAVSSDRCMSCHGEREFVDENIAGEDLDFVLGYQDSIHGEQIECSDCHTGHHVLPPDDRESDVNRSNIGATCAKCHDDIAEVYNASEHGVQASTGAPFAPVCTDCHGEHDIYRITDSDSRISREHEIEVCQGCHLNTPEIRDSMNHIAGFITDYAESVHGRAHDAGNANAAICSDCHGGHEEMRASNPGSKVNQFNLASTCGNEDCHESIADEFNNSIHGQALVNRIADAPTCTSCHSEHAIQEHASIDSPVAPQNVSEQTCMPCHNSIKLSRKYGFPTDRGASFSDSYHGLAGQFGSTEVANCASCHGIHDILPSTDPQSRVSPAGLVETCGSCHPGASANFASGSVHIVRTPQGDRVLYWITFIYILLIVGTIGAMTAHNALDYFRKLIETHRKRISPPPPPAIRKTGLYIRMTRNERVQHFLLASSFIILVLTGFMLKFPNAWWVLWLRSLFPEVLLDLRGLLHRFAAVVMTADAIYHLYYIIFTERGRQFLRDIFFRMQDLKDLIQMMKYNLGRAKERPRFARFNYIEKSEYWALIWGTIMMTVTGIALWFENLFINLFSKFFIDVCETLHYWEAWLAFLAIVVWHFYYVIFNPDVYPMNLTWLTGTVTEEEMEHEHPLELEELRKKEN